MTTERTLVAGIGNIFLGDDGLGCEVVRRLSQAELPAGVHVVDYGIRGLHLAYDLLDGCDRLVLVDAHPCRQVVAQEDVADPGDQRPLSRHRCRPRPARQRAASSSAGSHAAHLGIALDVRDGPHGDHDDGGSGGAHQGRRGDSHQLHVSVLLLVSGPTEVVPSGSSSSGPKYR